MLLSWQQRCNCNLNRIQTSNALFPTTTARTQVNAIYYIQHRSTTSHNVRSSAIEKCETALSNWNVAKPKLNKDTSVG